MKLRKKNNTLYFFLILTTIFLGISSCNLGGEENGEDSPVVLGVTITPENSVISGGTTQQFIAVSTFNNGSTKDITLKASWNSSNPDVVNVDSNGLATGINNKSGYSIISAEYEGITGETTLTVEDQSTIITSFEISPGTATIDAEETQQFTATVEYKSGETLDVTTSVIWSSSDTDVATIDANSGLATGTSGADGNTEITGSYTEDGVTVYDIVVLSVGETIALPVISNIDLYRGASSANTEMHLWSDWKSNGITAGTTAFDTGDTDQYAYIGGFDSVTLVISTDTATSYTIDGLTYTPDANTFTHTVVFTAQGENVISIVAGNAGGDSTKYTVTVNFLNHYNWTYGVYAPYMLGTKNQKWYAINPDRGKGDELAVAGNTSGSMYWKINNSYTINCDEVNADEAAEYFGDDGSKYCGGSGLFGAFNRISLTNYNDGNSAYSGSQDGYSWSADWYGPANEGGMLIEGDSIGDITNVMAKDGNLRGLYEYYQDGVLIAKVYQHYVIDNGDVKVDPNTFSDYVYMPGTVWEETVRYVYNPSEDDPLE